MSAIRGTNALCYIGGTKAPLANEWTLDITQERIEAPHSFVCPTDASSQWTERAGGYYSGSFTMSCLYDDADDTPITGATSDTEQVILLYPHCDATTKYWIGTFLLDISMTTGVDDYVTVDLSGDANGQVQWAPNAS